MSAASKPKPPYPCICTEFGLTVNLRETNLDDSGPTNPCDICGIPTSIKDLTGIACYPHNRIHFICGKCHAECGGCHLPRSSRYPKCISCLAKESKLPAAVVALTRVPITPAASATAVPDHKAAPQIKPKVKNTPITLGGYFVRLPKPVH